MRVIYITVFFSLILSSCKTEELSWLVVPYPNDVSLTQAFFTFDGGVGIKGDLDDLTSTVSYFEEKLGSLGIKTGKNFRSSINITISDSFSTNHEAYRLDIQKRQINIIASGSSGLFYAFTTIYQQLLLSGNSMIPCGQVLDQPRFGYRGFMLDESRHFFGKEKVMQVLDMMSLFKLNTFHWHLTDAPGWRIEIKSYPRLAAIGGRGDDSNPDGPAQYYTQEEIKEIVDYAAERYILIIPEIDMPGHATAANKAYPEFSGGGSEKRPDFTFNPGKEETYQFLTAILREVSDLFPSSYIHFGGDEVHFGNQQWKNDKYVKGLMKREEISDIKEVERYFSRRMADTIQSLGKITGGWDEVVHSGLSNSNTLVYWWRHDREDQLKASLAGEYFTVLCPRRPLYFDFVQHESHKNGRRWEGYCPIEDVYAYPDNNHIFTKEEIELIDGIQACLWTENYKTSAWIDFMSYPRLFALAESAWTIKENKDYSRFEASLPHIFSFLDRVDISYFNILNDSICSEPPL